MKNMEIDDTDAETLMYSINEMVCTGGMELHELKCLANQQGISDAALFTALIEVYNDAPEELLNSCSDAEQQIISDIVGGWRECAKKRDWLISASNISRQ